MVFHLPSDDNLHLADAPGGPSIPASAETVISRPDDHHCRDHDPRVLIVGHQQDQCRWRPSA